MRDIIITLFVLGTLPFVLARPYVGVLVWSWLGYMNPHRLTWGFAYNIPFAQMVGLVTLIALVFNNEPKRVPVNATTVVWLLFIVWMCITTLAALDPAHSVWELERTLKIQLIVFVTLMTITNRERLDALIWVIVVSLSYYGVKGGLFTILTGGQFMVWGPPSTHIAGNNEIALALVMTLPLMRYLLLTTTKPTVRWGLLLAMLFVTAAVIGTYSRGAFLAISVMAFFLFLKGNRKLLLGSIAVIVAVVGISLMPAKWSERMATIKTWKSDSSALGRVTAWRMAIKLANDRPLVGGGFDTFRPEVYVTYLPNLKSYYGEGGIQNEVPDAHSIYFEVLGEHGYIGLTLFLLLGILTLRLGKVVRNKIHDRTDLHWAGYLATMVQVSVIGYSVGGAFLGLAYFDLYYHLMAIMVLTNQVVDDRLAEIPHVVRVADAGVGRGDAVSRGRGATMGQRRSRATIKSTRQ